jgi:uncharacterized protein YkwD
MKKIIFILAVLTSVQASALWEYRLYNEISSSNFRSNPIFNETINPDKTDYRLLNAAVFFVTNEERAKRNIPLLEHSVELESAAWYHSKRMEELNFFSHYGRDPERKDPIKRAGLAGVANPMIAENIASTHGIKMRSGQRIYPINIPAGEFSASPGGPIIPFHTYLSFAEEIVRQWMNSPGHRANILSRDNLQIGCGIYCFKDKKFYNIFKCNGTQNFQSFKKIIKKKPVDTVPFPY